MGLSEGEIHEDDRAGFPSGVVAFMRVCVVDDTGARSGVSRCDEDAEEWNEGAGANGPQHS
jgi:hypothetical protein